MSELSAATDKGRVALDCDKLLAVRVGRFWLHRAVHISRIDSRVTHQRGWQLTDALSGYSINGGGATKPQMRKLAETISGLPDSDWQAVGDLTYLRWVQHAAPLVAELRERAGEGRT